MNPLERVVGLKRQHTGEQLVEGHPERVEVGAVIDPAVHAPRLLGGHIGQRPFDDARALQRGLLAADAHGEAQVGDAHLAGARVDRDVLRLDVLVDEAALMQLAEGLGDADRQREEGGEIHRIPVELVERLLLLLHRRISDSECGHGHPIPCCA